MTTLALNDEDLIRSGEACRLLGVSMRTLDRFVSDGLLAARYLPNGHRRFRRSDVLALLDDRGAA